MGLALLLKLSLKCFLNILAWPLLSLGYPLCASIRAIETDSNSDIQKLITYWVLFSLISLFDHAFARLLEWLSFWPYIKLMTILWLVVPHFDGSYYVYENLVRPCLSVNPWVFVERYDKRRAEFLLNKENFLIAAESYVKENGPEALERLIASKRTKPNDVKEIKAVEVIEDKEVTAERTCKDPNVARREIKAVEVTENKEAVTAKGVNQTAPNLAQSENHVFAAAGSKETTTIAGSDSKLTEVLASKKENFVVAAEGYVKENGIEALERLIAGKVNQTAPNLAQSKNHVFAAAGSKETTTIAGSDSKLPEILASKKENFLVVAEGYVKENGTEALERLIAGKVNQTAPNLAQRENNIFAAAGSKETTMIASTDSKLPEILASKKVNFLVAAEGYFEENGIEALEGLIAGKVNQTAPNLAQSENHVFAAAGSKETTTIAGSDGKLPEILASKKENFLVAAEGYVKENGIEALERLIACKVNQTAPNLAQSENNVFAAAGSKEATTIAGSDSKLPEILASKKENFLVAAEGYVKENGIEALERLSAGKVKCKEPNVAQKEIKAVEVTEKKEVAGAKWLNCNEPNVAQKGIKAVEVTGKKDVPAAKLFKCKEPNVAQKEIKAVEVTERKQVAGAKWVKQTELNLDQTENQTFTDAGNDETLKTAAVTAGSGSELPKIPDTEKVQREWTCALCQVTTQSEITLNSHLQGKRHKAAYDELKAKNWAAKNKVSPASTANYKKSDQPREETKKCVSSNGSNQKNTGNQVDVFGKQQYLNKTSVVNIKQSTLWCNICNIRCPGEIDMACHLNGRKHFARIEELNGFAGGWA